MFLNNFLNIFIFLIVSIVLGLVAFILPYFLSAKNDDKEKLSSYECGFNPFSDSRNEFAVKFYLVAILFIIFDLEISFLFPFILCLDLIGSLGIFAMFVFLLILTVGFVYE
jgi:NADH-quinone oxidoreductase subunit A